MQHPHLQNDGSSFTSRFGAVRSWYACGVLAVAIGACGDEYCDAQSGQDCSFADAFDDSARDDDPPPCSSLGEADCRRSGRCFVDSVCKAPACSGPSCATSCELVRTCVDY